MPSINGELTLLVHCLHYMLPLNCKRTTSSLAPPIIYVAKNGKFPFHLAFYVQSKICALGSERIKAEHKMLVKSSLIFVSQFRNKQIPCWSETNLCEL